MSHLANIDQKADAFLQELLEYPDEIAALGEHRVIALADLIEALGKNVDAMHIRGIWMSASSDSQDMHHLYGDRHD